MTDRGRSWAHGLIIILGTAAMVGGFVTGKTGAGIAGLLITGINIEPWRRAVRPPLRRSGPPVNRLNGNSSIGGRCGKGL